MSDYEVCPECLNDRGKVSFEDYRCYLCKKTGYIRKPASYVCNGCGECLCPSVHDENPNKYYPYGLVEAAVTGGYESFHLFDFTTYKFSLCEFCLRKLFSTFKIPPNVSGEMGDETYEEDLAQYETRVRAEHCELKEK